MPFRSKTLAPLYRLGNFLSCTGSGSKRFNAQRRQTLARVNEQTQSESWRQLSGKKQERSTIVHCNVLSTLDGHDCTNLFTGSASTTRFLPNGSVSFPRQFKFHLPFVRVNFGEEFYFIQIQTTEQWKMNVLGTSTLIANGAPLFLQSPLLFLFRRVFFSAPGINSVALAACHHQMLR